MAERGPERPKTHGVEADAVGFDRHLDGPLAQTQRQLARLLGKPVERAFDRLELPVTDAAFDLERRETAIECLEHGGVLRSLDFEHLTVAPLPEQRSQTSLQLGPASRELIELRARRHFPAGRHRTLQLLTQ